MQTTCIVFDTYRIKVMPEMGLYESTFPKRGKYV